MQSGPEGHNLMADNTNNHGDNNDDERADFDAVEILDWLQTTQDSKGGQQTNSKSSDTQDADTVQTSGDLGDLVSSDQVVTVISDMGFDVTALDELSDSPVSEGQGITDDGLPQPFGDGYSTISVKITDNGRQAFLESLQLGDINNPPTLEELKEVIRTTYRVTTGFDDSKLSQLIERACKRAIWDGKTVFAEATLPDKGSDGRVVYHIETDRDTGKPLDGDQLSKALSGDDIRAALKIKGNPVLVQPGAKIATVETPKVGESGINVFGEEIVFSGKLANRPAAGKGVREEGEVFVAETLGYVCAFNNALHILPPLWLDKDNCAARFLYFPQPQTAPDVYNDVVMGLLDTERITFGINEDAIEKLGSSRAGRKRSAIIIARGNRVVHGENAHFTPDFETGKDSADGNQGGSVDFRKTNAYIPVSKGDLLGEFVPATTGVAGTTIYGDEVEASGGEQISEFAVGEGVRIEQQGRESRKPQEHENTDTNQISSLTDWSVENKASFFFADIDGSARYENNKLEVLPLLVIPGDVDLHVGHISTRGDVKILGSIQYGFNIKCGGDVEIGGGVENGVTIQALGNVTVGKSVIGNETCIIAGGFVKARLIHNSRVVAQGDIELSHSAVNARLSSGATITVIPGSGRAGSIVGGETFATTFVQAKNLGSPGMEPTRVGCRPSPQELAELASLRNKLQKNREIVGRSMKWMGVNKFDKKQIDRALSVIPENQRETFAKALREGVKAATELAQLPITISRKEQEHLAIIRRGQIRASDAFFAEVVIEFDNRETRILDKNVGGRYMFIDDEIRWRPPT